MTVSETPVDADVHFSLYSGHGSYAEVDGAPIRHRELACAMQLDPLPWTRLKCRSIRNEPASVHLESGRDVAGPAGVARDSDWPPSAGAGEPEFRRGEPAAMKDSALVADVRRAAEALA